jgi:hypothetical protein
MAERLRDQRSSRGGAVHLPALDSSPDGLARAAACSSCRTAYFGALMASLAVLSTVAWLLLPACALDPPFF